MPSKGGTVHRGAPSQSSAYHMSSSPKCLFSFCKHTPVWVTQGLGFLFCRNNGVLGDFGRGLSLKTALSIVVIPSHHVVMAVPIPCHCDYRKIVFRRDHKAWIPPFFARQKVRRNDENREYWASLRPDRQSVSERNAEEVRHVTHQCLMSSAFFLRFKNRWRKTLRLSCLQAPNFAPH